MEDIYILHKTMNILSSINGPSAYSSIVGPITVTTLFTGSCATYAMSRDGSSMFYLNDQRQVWVSTDSGASFTNKSTLPTFKIDTRFTSSNISNGGQYIIIATGNVAIGTYYSSDGGTTWTTYSDDQVLWENGTRSNRPAMDSTGRFVAGFSKQTTPTRRGTISVNYGLGPLPVLSTNGVADISSDAEFAYTANSRSTNANSISGGTISNAIFTSYPVSPQYGQTPSCSSNGRYVILPGANTGVLERSLLFSSDFGATFKNLGGTTLDLNAGRRGATTFQLRNNGEIWGVWSTAGGSFSKIFKTDQNGSVFTFKYPSVTVGLHVNVTAQQIISSDSGRYILTFEGTTQIMVGDTAFQTGRLVLITDKDYPETPPTNPMPVFRVRLDNTTTDIIGNATATSAALTYSNVLPADNTHSAVLTSVVGTKAHLTYSSVAGNVTSGMTVALWLRITGVLESGGTALQAVYFDVGGTSGAIGVNLRRSAGQSYDPTGTVAKNYTINGSSETLQLRDNIWMHLIFVMDRVTSTTTVTWYLNGAVQPLITTANAAHYPSPTTSVGNVRMGSAISGTNAGLVGQIDDVRVYASAVSSDFADFLGAGGNRHHGSVNDMVVRYTFETLEGTNFRNTVTNSTVNDLLAINNCTRDTALFILGQASLANSHSTSRARTNFNNRVLSAGGHTFAFWWRLTSSTGANQALFGCSSANAALETVGLRMPNSTNRSQLVAISDGNTVAFQAVTIGLSLTLANNTWYHITAVFTTASPARCVLYIDGFRQTDAVFSTGINTGAMRTQLECMGAPGGGSLNGNMDDFRYYNRALSDADAFLLHKVR